MWSKIVCIKTASVLNKRKNAIIFLLFKEMGSQSEFKKYSVMSWLSCLRKCWTELTEKIQKQQ